MITRRLFLASSALAATSLALPSLAATPGPIFTEQGVAIRGADPVAYFTQSAPVIGSPEFSHNWGDAIWHFTSAAHRDMFAENPEAYAPQYGGNCAWAVAQGYLASTIPEAWQIVDGKLYMNFSRRIQRRWERDIPGHIAQGNENWPGLQAQG